MYDMQLGTLKGSILIKFPLGYITKARMFASVLFRTTYRIY